MDLPLPPDLSMDTEWPEDENEEDYEEEEEEEEEADYDAAAEEMARRLGDQLLADIAKAQIEAGLSQPQASPQTTVPQPQAALPSAPAPTHPAPGAVASKTIVSMVKKQEAALATMKAIIGFAAKDAQVRATLSATLVAHGPGSNIYDILTQCISASRVSKPLAKPLSDAVVSLAKSETLFASLRNSDAAAIQLDKGKRKRDSADDGFADARNLKRAAIEYPDLLVQMSEAARVVSNAFVSRAPSNHPPDPALVLSIHHQLHQIFLFAVTSTPRGRPELQAALQELGGLIQMIGILSNVPIGPEPIPPATAPWADGTQPADIGAAVYPCLIGPCTKVFHRLYSLRTHQRLHTLVDRPFRCTVCPASFLRNHDLKRHLRLHDKKAWKCAGCDKIFSRRDAIKRHKDARGRGLSGGKGREDPAEAAICATAAILEVEVDRDEGDEDATRRAKIWNGIVANQIADSVAAGHLSKEAVEDGIEEGEIPLPIVQQAQDVIMRLHPILHSHVAGPLGGAPPPTFHPGPPPELPQQAPVPPQDPPPMAALLAPPPVQPQAPPAAVADPSADQDDLSAPEATAPATGLSWLSEDQTKLLEQAIAQATSAAQALAEAEAALEEDEEEEEEGDEEDEEGEEIDIEV
ncbi:Metallothionein expression activator [Steccherinum ochraceum]|uniref:Metallothionein expression activator n=1 Tax=Steccherinum ochraceum TaxID=92696 RepID=A0A4R0S0C7_9APHY|nr:Metallothionein expression activator [Steccherinum ochraceum]